jgi:pimeloyl-ACP methyl ester carboxylesterase
MIRGKRFAWLGLSLLLLGSPTLAQSDAAGDWKGAISLPNGELGILVQLKHDQSQWKGTIDIPAQGVKSMALGEITVEGSNVSFKMPGVPGNPTFKGTLATDGREIVGDFKQGPSKLPFRLERLSLSDIEAAEQREAELRLESVWRGTLKTGMADLRLQLRIYRAPDGTLSGKLDSIDQGARNLEIAKIRVTSDRLSFDMTMPPASYEGDFNADQTEITGRWHQGGATLPLVFKKSDEQIELRRPQEPKPPYPYKEEEVTYENLEAGVKLAGTLTLPRSEMPAPAVILISGSGPQDRNETIMGHRPFLVLADYLTRKGIAVLRSDDRGVGGSTGNTLQATTRDFAKDALCGIRYLQSRKEIDPQQIGLVGHSEGGIVAPLAASESHAVAFIVLMAGTGLTGEEILVKQSELMGRAAGQSEQEVAGRLEIQLAMIQIVKAEPDLQIAERKLGNLIDEKLAEMGDQERIREGVTRAFLEMQARRINSPWLRFFITYDPTQALRKVRCPVLAVNGSLDLQVPPKEDLEAIAKALREGGNADFKTVELPGLNHLFQTARTGAVSEYSQIEETIAPQALELITGWILKHTQSQG